MKDADKLVVDAEAWEHGTLGQDEQFAVRANKEAEEALNEALGLQMISVRLQTSLIEDLKFIAKINGIGYQPLLRDALCRFARNEKKNIMMEMLERKHLENALENNKDNNSTLSDGSQIHKKAA